jgi:hypothetical protein
MKALAALGVLVAVLAIAVACGSSSGDGNNNNNGGTGNDGGNNGTGNDGGTGGTGHLIGGTILTAGASGLVLATPGEPNLTIPNSYQPAFHFANPVPTGTSYNVTVVSQPSTSNCNGAICTCGILDGGVGLVGTTDVTTVEIVCAIMLP